MCGIAGYAGRALSREHADAELTAMCGAIRHRGPDDEGHYVAPGVALGMRRLSVIDVAGGHQPVANEDGRVTVVFNGEIYNYRSLRDELAPRHVLRTRSDTEVLVHLYEDFGPRFVTQLRGMFAFAIWDAARETLTLARDRLGIKPLYYWPRADGVAFASELKSFLALPEFPATVDVTAVHEYLALGYVPDPSCIYTGVHKLLPGHVLTWHRDTGISIEKYWTPVLPEQPVLDEREAIAELQRLIADAVSCHLESDVRLGAFLSGGIDSSSVVAQMVQLSSSKVETFSIGFDEPEFNEAPHAAKVAEALGTKHTELIVRPDADALVEEIIDTYDEPFGDASSLPTLLVSRLAREHVTVALSGDGGDELFAGYTRYGEIADASSLAPVVRSAVHALASRLPHGAYGRNKLLDLARTRRGRYAATVAQSLSVELGGVVKSSDRSLALENLLDRWFEPASGRDFITQMTLVDISSYLPGDILTKVDRASMRVSLEARVPLLDHHLVEFAIGLPSSLKRRAGVGKWMLREAMKGIVPASVFQQPKRGFAVPLGAWMRKELRHRLNTLLDARRPVYEFVDHPSVTRIVQEHLGQRRDHSHYLWRILALDLWLVRSRRQPAATG